MQDKKNYIRCCTVCTYYITYPVMISCTCRRQANQGQPHRSAANQGQPTVNMKSEYWVEAYQNNRPAPPWRFDGFQCRNQNLNTSIQEVSTKLGPVKGCHTSLRDLKPYKHSLRAGIIKIVEAQKLPGSVKFSLDHQHNFLGYLNPT